jgi:CheY-like chemotaxis protein
MCILIVEDDPTSAKVIEANLNKNGYETTTASTGKQALQYLADREFELILLDVMISEVGELELLTEIKDHADQNKIPMFMCTAPTLEQIAAGKRSDDTWKIG